jgi:hypothetical protein
MSYYILFENVRVYLSLEIVFLVIEHKRKLYSIVFHFIYIYAFIYHKIKGGVMFRNYGFLFPSKIQMPDLFLRPSREIKIKPVRVSSSSLNQYSVPLHMSTYRQWDYSLQSLCNGRFARPTFKARLRASTRTRPVMRTTVPQYRSSHIVACSGSHTMLLCNI